jgi:hypothetical protein
LAGVRGRHTSRSDIEPRIYGFRQVFDLSKDLPDREVAGELAAEASVGESIAFRRRYGDRDGD